jgi:rod shape-determining protein MreC
VPYSPTSASRAGDVAGTLRLLAYLALSIVLMALDHRGGWMSGLRDKADLVVQPLWAVAGWPGRVARSLDENVATRGQLLEENARLRNELLVTGTRLARLRAAASENARLRALLGAVERGGLDVQLAPILDIDLDPTRQRLVLDAGSGDGVRVGQVAIDAGGVVGQIIETAPLQATVLLLTDADHAIPVAIARNGVRLVAYGTGSADRLALASVPLSSDVKVGDVLVTSGLGGRFAAGFPVGTITALRPDESRAFLVGDVKPAAQLDRGRDVLLLRTLPPRPVIGETASAAAPTQAAGTTAPGAAATQAAGGPKPATPAGPVSATAPATPANPNPAGTPPQAPPTQEQR